MFLHLSYTMSPVDIADSMEAAGSSHAIVVVLFDPAPCFMINERELMPFGMVWEKYMRDGRVRIRFSFVNDSVISPLSTLSSGRIRVLRLSTFRNIIFLLNQIQ